MILQNPSAPSKMSWGNLLVVSNAVQYLRCIFLRVSPDRYVTYFAKYVTWLLFNCSKFNGITRVFFGQQASEWPYIALSMSIHWTRPSYCTRGCLTVPDISIINRYSLCWSSLISFSDSWPKTWSTDLQSNTWFGGWGLSGWQYLWSRMPVLIPVASAIREPVITQRTP